MSNTPEAIVRRWFKEVWDDGNEDAIEQLTSPDVVVHGLGGPDAPPMRGPAEFKKVFHTFHEALGDLEIAVDRTITQGDTCAAYCRVKGHHVGKELGGPPTHKPVAFAGVTIVIVRDGKIVEAWNCFDFLAMYQQIGWVGNPPLP